MRNKKLKWVSGSLHSHGFWTEYRNWHEQKLAPFNLDFFVKTCMRYGRDFQAVLDIMANQKGRNEFQENRYDKLIKTANSRNNFYEITSFPVETKISFKDGKEFYIIRTQEVITDNLRQHILALNLEENISGGRTSEEILKEIKDKGGYAFINHPFVCDAFTKEQVLKFYEEGLILGTEWNGGVTIYSFLGKYIGMKLAEKPPLKKDNKRVLELEKVMPVIANDDARCTSDVKKGAYTEYLVDSDSYRTLTSRLVDSIKTYDLETGNLFKRHEKYSSWHSIWLHGFNGIISQLTYGENSLPKI